jgi:hypothetical protein
MPVTPQMILANMNETNQRMQRLELIINDKLSKLDLLDVLNDKLGKFEQNLSGINNSSTKNFFTTFSVFSIAPSDLIPPKIKLYFME